MEFSIHHKYFYSLVVNLFFNFTLMVQSGHYIPHENVETEAFFGNKNEDWDLYVRRNVNAQTPFLNYAPTGIFCEKCGF